MCETHFVATWYSLLLVLPVLPVWPLCWSRCDSCVTSRKSQELCTHVQLWPGQDGITQANRDGIITKEAEARGYCSFQWDRVGFVPFFLLWWLQRGSVLLALWAAAVCCICTGFLQGGCSGSRIRDCLQHTLVTTWGHWCPLPCLFTELICALNVLNQEHSGWAQLVHTFLHTDLYAC